VNQYLQIAGALLILAAYVAAQFWALDQRSYPYLLLNLFGSAILAVLALVGRQWGFLLLEGASALVSVWSILVRLRGGVPGPAH
jgi:hypothetical protein